MKSLSFIFPYLKKPKQKTKTGSTFSECLNILNGVSQGSNLGPVLFIKFVVDLFYSNYDLNFTSCAVHTTPYICEHNFSGIIKVL